MTHEEANKLNDRTPDIEIYIKDCDPQATLSWLQTIGTDVKILEQSSAHIKGELQSNQAQIPFLLVVNAVKKFSSLWLNSPNTPWKNDLECALSASSALKRETRCAVSSWEEEENPDDERWWKVTEDGKTQVRWDI
ncbi:MAG: hypothetical protein H7A00_00135 [Hahellaceae bacterium]|nr:hypothetical protein [Hahellaceae bacterium]